MHARGPDVTAAVQSRHAAAWPVLAVVLLLLAGCNFSGRPQGGASAPAAAAAAAVEPAAGSHQPDSYRVFPGDTVYGVAQRFGVPVRTLIETNGLKPPYRLTAGQQLRVPVRQEHVVQPGDNLFAISRIYGVDQSSLARANNLSAPFALTPGQRLLLPGRIEASLAAIPPEPMMQTADRTASLPGAMSVEDLPSPLPVPLAVTAPVPDPAMSPVPAEPVEGVARTMSSDSEIAAIPETTPVEPQVDVIPEDASREPDIAVIPDSTGTEPEIAAIPDATPRSSARFQWPVDGQIVSRFGAKTGGLHNDGINIAASAGTTVVAAADGVVAYAGNELRGFGNLLLIRHPDGWVTAYAHNDKLLVRQGDKVRRGQPIAQVGSTGSVSSPQLHFEIRRGTNPVDPLEHLAARSVSLSPAGGPNVQPSPG